MNRPCLAAVSRPHRPHPGPAGRAGAAVFVGRRHRARCPDHLGGLAGSDTCERNDRLYRFPVRFPQQNIWSRAVPQEPCVEASLWGSTRVAAGARECFWPQQKFYGWQVLNLVGSTAYSDILAQYAGW